MLQRVLDLAEAAGGQAAIERQANFYLGVTIYFVIAELDNATLDAESCDAVEEEERWITIGKEALTAGASLAQGTADQLMGVYNQYEARIPQLRDAFCS